MGIEESFSCDACKKVYKSIDEVPYDVSVCLQGSRARTYSGTKQPLIAPNKGFACSPACARELVAKAIIEHDLKEEERKNPKAGQGGYLVPSQLSTYIDPSVRIDLSPRTLTSGRVNRITADQNGIITMEMEGTDSGHESEPKTNDKR